MALRISSAEIVSSAMARLLFFWFWSGAVAGAPAAAAPVLSAGQPPAGNLESVGDAAVDDLVVDADHEAALHRRVDLDLQPHGPPVEALEHGDEALLLRCRQRQRADHVCDRPAAPTG